LLVGIGSDKGYRDSSAHPDCLCCRSEEEDSERKCEAIETLKLLSGSVLVGVEGIDDGGVDELELRLSDRCFRRSRGFNGRMMARGGDACAVGGFKRCIGTTIANAVARTLWI
jgi:hypothetical protein